MTLELITGPMFSGKTLELIRRLQIAEADGARVSAGKPSLDLERGWLVSSAGRRWPARPLEGAETILSLVRDNDVFGVDEVQFLGPAEAECLHAAAADGVRVIAAGLDLDFRGVPFPRLERLSRGADSVTRLAATCAQCGAAATRSQRLVAGRPAAFSAPTVVLGGPDLYEPRCPACHEVPQDDGESAGLDR